LGSVEEFLENRYRGFEKLSRGSEKPFPETASQNHMTTFKTGAKGKQAGCKKQSRGSEKL
jgi:hypothetical protein